MSMLFVGCLLLMLSLMSMEVVGFMGGTPATNNKKGAIVSVTDGDGNHKCHAILIVNMSTVLGRTNCIEAGATVVGGEESTQDIKGKANAQKKKIKSVTKHCDGFVSLGTLESVFTGKNIDFFIPHWIPEAKTKGTGMMLSWGRVKPDGGTEGRKIAEVEMKFEKCDSFSKLSKHLGTKTGKANCAEHKIPEKVVTYEDDTGAVILMKLDKFRPNPVGFLLDQAELGEPSDSTFPMLFEDTSKYVCWAINFLWETSCGGPIGKCNADLAPGQGRAPQSQISTTVGGQLLFWSQIAMAGFIQRYLFQ